MADNIIDLGFGIAFSDEQIEAEAEKIVKILNAAIDKGAKFNVADKVKTDASIETLQKLSNKMIKGFKNIPAENYQEQINQLMQIQTIGKALQKLGQSENLFSGLKIDGKQVNDIEQMQNAIKNLQESIVSLQSLKGAQSIFPQELTGKAVQTLMTNLKKSVSDKLNEYAKGNITELDESTLKEMLTIQAVKQRYNTKDNSFRDMNADNARISKFDFTKDLGLQNVSKEIQDRIQEQYQKAVQNIDVSALRILADDKIRDGFKNFQLIPDKTVEDAGTKARESISKQIDKIKTQIQDISSLLYSKGFKTTDKQSGDVLQLKKLLEQYKNLTGTISKEDFLNIYDTGLGSKTNHADFSDKEWNKINPDPNAAKEAESAKQIQQLETELKKEKVLRESAEKSKAEADKAVTAKEKEIDQLQQQINLLNPLRNKVQNIFTGLGGSNEEFNASWEDVGKVLLKDIDICEQFKKALPNAKNLNDVRDIFALFENYSYDLNNLKNTKTPNELRNNLINDLKVLTPPDTNNNIENDTNKINENTEAIEKNTAAKRENAETPPPTDPVPKNNLTPPVNTTPKNTEPSPTPQNNIDNITVNTEKIKNAISSAINQGSYIIENIEVNQDKLASIKQNIDNAFGSIKINADTTEAETKLQALSEKFKTMRITVDAAGAGAAAENLNVAPKYNIDIAVSQESLTGLKSAIQEVLNSQPAVKLTNIDTSGAVISNLVLNDEIVAELKNKIQSQIGSIQIDISVPKIESVADILKNDIIEQLNNFKNIDSGALDVIKNWEVYISRLADKIAALYTGIKNVVSATATNSNSLQASNLATDSKTQTNEGAKQVQQANSKTEQAQIQTSEAAKQTAEAEKQKKQAEAKTAESKKQTIEAQKQSAANSQYGATNKDYAANTLKELHILFSKTQKKYFAEGLTQQLKAKQTEILKLVDNVQRKEKAYTQGNVERINAMKQSYIEMFNLFMSASPHKGNAFNFNSKQMLTETDNMAKTLQTRNVTDYDEAILSFKQKVGEIQTALADLNNVSYKDLKKLENRISGICTRFEKLKSNISHSISQDGSGKAYVSQTNKELKKLFAKGNDPRLSANYAEQLMKQQTAIEELMNKIETKQNAYTQKNIDKVNTMKQAYADMLNTFIKASPSNGSAFGFDPTKMTAELDKLSGKLQFKHITSLNDTIAQLKQQIITLNPSISKAGSMSEQELKDLQTKILGITTQFIKLRDIARESLSNDTSISSINKLNARFDDLIAKMQRYYAQNTKIQRDHNIDSQFRSMVSSAQTMERSTANLNQLNSQYQMLRNTIESKGLTGRSIGDELKYIAEKIGLKAILGNQVYRVIGYFKQMVTVVKQIDTGMTSLKRVSDETAQSYKKFLQSAKGDAKELGSELNSVVDATSSFARLGYNLQESNKLAQNAIMYKNVGWLDIETATNDLVSTMKAFNITAEDSIKIVDTFDTLGNKFALTSADVGSGLKTSASALAAANNTMEQSAAMITAITEITQDSSNAGNALKVLAMRLRGASAELQEEGEDVEGLCDSTSKLRDKLQSLAGVDIMQDEDTFKSTYQIMSEIAHEWDKISDINQAALLETIAGKTRANQVAALLNNWSQAEKALENSLNSAGTAAKENEIYLDSIEGKIVQLKATAQGLSNDLINSSWIKGFVDTINTVLTGFDSITDGLQKLSDKLDHTKNKEISKYFDTWKSVPSILTAVTVALTAMKKEVGMKMPFTPATEFMHKPENCWEALMPVYQSAA